MQNRLPDVAGSAGEVSLYIGGQGAYRKHGVAQSGFGAVQGLAPIVYIKAGLHVYAGWVGRRAKIRIGGHDGKEMRKGNPGDAAAAG